MVIRKLRNPSLGIVFKLCPWVGETWLHPHHDVVKVDDKHGFKVQRKCKPERCREGEMAHHRRPSRFYIHFRKCAFTSWLFLLNYDLPVFNGVVLRVDQLNVIDAVSCPGRKIYVGSLLTDWRCEYRLPKCVHDF